jgi:hypothetical protein
MVFVITQWVNEYYEITPKEVIHKTGFFLKKEEKHMLEHLGKLEIEQGLLGRIFNFGTLKLNNWALGKDAILYLIHNPMKYHYILETLLPNADEQKQILREHMVYKETV